jgi:formylglycine-generating enzyme required for sulfatase activity
MHALLAFALAPLLLAQEPGTSAGPPGLVSVRGGRTKIGSTIAEVEGLIRQHPELSLAVAGEAPQFTLEVEDFLLMPTEVTNEQYLAFVRATGARPPRSWAASALREGERAFLDERARAEKEPSDRAEFDPNAWWEAHWRESAWEVPPTELAHPVVFVSYADAQHYARWAGLRLMTEFEFQRAGRGDTARTYPWGDDWDDRRYCQLLHAGRDSTAVVGSFEGGASGGVYDLAGNVWEWTSSPFDPYPGYKPVRVELKDRVVEAFGPFSSEQRVVVGGSFQMDKTGVRLAIRKYTDPTQSTSALGFRCAASLVPGLDAAQWIVSEDVVAGALGRDTEWSPRLTSVRRRWKTEAGQAKVPGYRVITGYEHLLACPVASLAASNPVELGALSARTGPVLVALVSMPFATSSPALAPGTHLVAWRRADPATPGEKRQKNAAFGSAGIEDVPGFQGDLDCYLFFDLDGTPRAAVPAAPIAFSREKPSRVELASDPAASDSVHFVLCVPSARTASKGFFVELRLEAPAGTLGAGWD